MKSDNIKKFGKFLLKAIISIVAFLSLYLLAAYGLSRTSLNEEPGQLDEVTIYIKTNGVHTDIVVPIRNEIIDWTKFVKYADIKSKDTTYNYLAIGWGDKGFYLETPTWAELKASVAFKAATGLGSTAIHATFYKEMNINDSCRQIIISKNQYIRLINFIMDSTVQDENRQWINIVTNANYSKTDAFYEAKGSYSLFYTCNTWANNGLKKSGQKHCLWTPFDTGIFLNYK